jgi:hypothetical protein
LGLKKSIQLIEERNLESYDIENIHSFKTMLRMLYQSGVVVCSQSTAAVEIPRITFSSS